MVNYNFSTGATNPEADCVLLVNETEVLVSPKVRNSAIGQPIEPLIKRSSSKTQEVPFIPSQYEDANFDTKFKSTDSDISDKGKISIM
jgi:hypothetical protein